MIVMKIETKKFGNFNINEKDIIIFKKGLLAFENSRKFVIININENPAFKWLQSVENTGIAFLLIDPFLVKTNYFLDIDDNIQKELEIENKEDVMVYTIVTVPQSGLKDATTNLAGPLVMNIKSKKGKQVVLENKNITTKYPLMNKRKKASCGD
jgi:flagellar assembly factor FliW